MQEKKEFEPSPLASGSPWRAVMELRKTCALCKYCHANITHSKSSMSKFMTCFNEDFGYNVDDVTGYVVNDQGSKSNVAK